MIFSDSYFEKKGPRVSDSFIGASRLSQSRNYWAPFIQFGCGALESNQVSLGYEPSKISVSLARKLVRVAGFEPATSRFQTEISSLTELHSDKF